MKRLYAYISPAGTFYICRVRRYYLAYFENQLIDSSSADPEEAARAVAASRHIALPPGFTFDELNIPADLHQWKEIE